MRTFFFIIFLALGALSYWALLSPPGRLPQSARLDFPKSSSSMLDEHGEVGKDRQRGRSDTRRSTLEGAPRALVRPRTLSGAKLMTHQLLPLDMLPEEEIGRAVDREGKALSLETPALIGGLEAIASRVRADLPLPIIEVSDLLPSSFYEALSLGPRARLVRLGDGLLDEPTQLTQLIEELRGGGVNYLGLSFLDVEGKHRRVYAELTRPSEDESL
ncbi:MAG: hypothetical protein VYD19_02420 [Myxococcota bacterium]|nr:hypothetical protein [Myxococcota bacterium]